MNRDRDDGPTDAEIDRSQARMEHALGAGFADEPADGRLGPGIHFDVPEATYRADPCEKPSLTQSIAKVLIERSPAHAWIEHPRLNPGHKPDDATKYDVGNIAHALLLGRGKNLEIIEADDWRTKAAKEARDAAAAQGRLGVLARKHRVGTAIANSARQQLAEIGWAPAGMGGHPEVVVIAQDGKIFLRSMIDWMVNPTLLLDLKTTDMSVAPRAIPSMLVSGGWAIQAAFQERILDILDPEGRGRRTFRFVAIEAEPPYALTPVELTEAVMTMGRKQVEYAVRLWAECVAENRWPAYPTDVCRPDYPGWKENEWLEREVADAGAARRKGTMISSLMGG